MKASGSKGYQMEEELRRYFLKSGYFVIRGAEMFYDRETITDVDLWLYARNTPVSREIAIVDIKNKKQPQAVERILWVSGLRTLLGADKAIVATTDRRKFLKEFANQLKIQVLDGSFLSKLKSYEKVNRTRLTEEEFTELLTADDLGKFDGDWSSQIAECRSLVVSGLDFDCFNLLLIKAKYFAEQVITNSFKSKLAARCLYLVVSYSLICIDYIYKDLAFREHDERHEMLLNGFLYGMSGIKRAQSIIDSSVRLIEAYLPEVPSASSIIKAKFLEEVDSSNCSILADFFASNDVSRDSFPHAKQLEQAAYTIVPQNLNRLSIEIKSLFGCLCDFWGISRVQLFESLE
ncbi:hypothetical protein [Shewanella algae]|uniref:hypothetical protein n=1 Tax=Shewanella algae TaxID=38313 RepID=UPI0011846EC3|nr:hypothetical protein [Shewanella algae]TVP01868.1 hypothetical protein AYI73_20045 [Shewanella algae]BCV39986.1 hypothetical protein TUM17378_12480 [Shewanella algae]